MLLGGAGGHLVGDVADERLLEHAQLGGADEQQRQLRHRVLGGVRGRPVLRGDVAGHGHPEDQGELLRLAARPVAVRRPDRDPATPDVVGIALLAGLGDLATQLAVGVGDQLGQQRVAVGEVAVQRRRGHPHLLGDVGEPDVDGPLLAHQPARHLLDLLDGGRALALAAGQGDGHGWAPPPRGTRHAGENALRIFTYVKWLDK